MIATERLCLLSVLSVSVYPFVQLCHHLFSSHVEECKLDEVVSRSQFFESSVYADIVRRSFDVKELAEYVLSVMTSHEIPLFAEKVLSDAGMWNAESRRFISNLLRAHIFRDIVKKQDVNLPGQKPIDLSAPDAFENVPLRPRPVPPLWRPHRESDGSAV